MSDLSACSGYVMSGIQWLLFLGVLSVVGVAAVAVDIESQRNSTMLPLDSYPSVE